MKLLVLLDSLSLDSRISRAVLGIDEYDLLEMVGAYASYGRNIH